MPLADVEHFIKKHPANVVRISGGEPTLHPSLDAIIGIIQNYCPQIELLTNGINYYEHHNIDRYYVSYVGLDSHKTILIHTERGHDVIVTSVLTHDAFVDDALDTANKLGIECHIYALQKQGRARKDNCAVTVTGQQGCNRDGKITITHDKKIVKCSADKEGENCEICKGQRVRN